MHFFSDLKVVTVFFSKNKFSFYSYNWIKGGNQNSVSSFCFNCPTNASQFFETIFSQEQDNKISMKFARSLEKKGIQSFNKPNDKKIFILKKSANSAKIGVRV